MQNGLLGRPTAGRAISALIPSEVSQHHLLEREEEEEVGVLLLEPVSLLLLLLHLLPSFHFQML